MGQALGYIHNADLSTHMDCQLLPYHHLSHDSVSLMALNSQFSHPAIKIQMMLRHCWSGGTLYQYVKSGVLQAYWNFCS